MPITLLWEHNNFTERNKSVARKDLISPKDRKDSYDCMWPNLQDSVAIATCSYKKGPANPNEFLRCEKTDITFYFPTEPNVCETLKISCKGNPVRGFSYQFEGLIPEEATIAEVLWVFSEVKKIVWGVSILDIVHDPYEHQIEIAITKSKNENTQSRRKTSKRRRVHGVSKKIQSQLGKTKIREKPRASGTKTTA